MKEDNSQRIADAVERFVGEGRRQGGVIRTRYGSCLPKLNEGELNGSISFAEFEDDSQGTGAFSASVMVNEPARLWAKSSSAFTPSFNANCVGLMPRQVAPPHSTFGVNSTVALKGLLGSSRYRKNLGFSNHSPRYPNPSGSGVPWSAIGSDMLHSPRRLIVMRRWERYKRKLRLIDARCDIGAPSATLFVQPGLRSRPSPMQPGRLMQSSR